jgi:F420-0:gamma-glutamyl ligase
MKICTPSAPLFAANADLIIYLKEALASHEAQLENAVLCITSKLVSLWEGRIFDRESATKADLIAQEADVFLGEVSFGSYLAVKENLFLASAGIDESNSEFADFILLPKNPNNLALKIQQALKHHFGLKCFGVILTDSRTSFLRYGVTGAAIGSAGICALRNCVGEHDLYGRQLKMTKINVVDGLAAAAVFMMGEAGEKTPLALITEIPTNKIEFCSSSEQTQLYVPIENAEFPSDLYWPFLAPGFRRATASGGKS